MALLFKALADANDLPCQLLRGPLYLGGSESHDPTSACFTGFHCRLWVHVFRASGMLRCAVATAPCG